MTVPLEGFLRQFDNYDGFEKQLSEDLLKDALPSGKKTIREQIWITGGNIFEKLAPVPNTANNPV